MRIPLCGCYNKVYGRLESVLESSFWEKPVWVEGSGFTV